MRPGWRRAFVIWASCWSPKIAGKPRARVRWARMGNLVVASIQSNSRYSVLPYFMRRMDKVGRRLAFRATTTRAHKVWKRELIATLKKITGYDTMIRCPLKPRITETTRLDDHTRQRIE